MLCSVRDKGIGRIMYKGRNYEKENYYEENYQFINCHSDGY